MGIGRRLPSYTAMRCLQMELGPLHGVLATIDHIGRFAVENIAERRMPVIAGTAEHGEVSVYFTRKHYSVAVEWQESIRQLIISR